MKKRKTDFSVHSIQGFCSQVLGFDLRFQTTQTPSYAVHELIERVEEAIKCFELEIQRDRPEWTDEEHQLLQDQIKAINHSRE
jgi:hypothetical protein